MIGVIAESSEYPVVREFFELFKTPWEFYRSNARYEIILCAGDVGVSEDLAKVIVIYAGRELSRDSEAGVCVGPPPRSEATVSYRGTRVPIYGECVKFARPDGRAADQNEPAESVICVDASAQKTVARIGYDLFREVRYLLTNGQPGPNAGIPTLDLHIAILRDLIIGSGAVLTEIPPVPEGYQFIACLTHDVDHPSIRSHRFDHTLFGFLHRAVFGSVRRFWQGRLPWRGVLSNWAAVLKLPLVHLRILEDFWQELDRYHLLERGMASTFFMIPFKGRPGRGNGGAAPPYRASGYGIADISSRVHRLQAAGCEIGVHGIDAWNSSSSGRAELSEVERVSGRSELGTRMHWLYFDEDSPAILEDAGFDYDSTFGYNGTVGYRAGTSQAYKPLPVRRLLELPLHVMDTALFYPRHLDLSPAEAKQRVREIVDDVARLGGCVTVNWHDRSIMPERLWGEFYGDLVDELKSRGAWFATASQAVAWFRQRRSVVFEHTRPESGAITATRSADAGQRPLPALRVRVHNAGRRQGSGMVDAPRLAEVVRRSEILEPSAVVGLPR
jgi:hypothetical protein